MKIRLPVFIVNEEFHEGIFLMKKIQNNLESSSKILFAERINGWSAMIGFWAVVGASLTTGQIIPGLA